METEPSPRWGHWSAAIGEQLYVYGGCTKTIDEDKKELASTIHIFRQRRETWQSQPANVESHPGLFHGTTAVSGNYLYLYGGRSGREPKDYSDTLHRLDTSSFEWLQLPGQGPSKKDGSGMLHCKGKLVLFGGYGFPSGPIQKGSDFVQRSGQLRKGWLNEVHCFDLKKEKWYSPSVSGSRPPPMAQFSLTKTDDHHAVLFGGYIATGFSNDVYTLDLIQMEWNKLKKDENQPWPEGRNAHSAVCLGYGEDYAQLLITGGQGVLGTSMGDAWILDLKLEKWKERFFKQIKSPGYKARHWHSSTAFNLGPRHEEITLFGGINEKEVACTTVMLFELEESRSSDGSYLKEWILREVAESSQLGTEERIRTKRSYAIAENTEYLEAYHRVLETRECIEMYFVKAILLGAPGLGKTTFRRRLTREIDDIESSGEGIHPSTGAVESGQGVFIRNLSTTTALVSSSEWQVIDDPTDEARVLFQLFYGCDREQLPVVQEEKEAKKLDHQAPLQQETVVSTSSFVVEESHAEESVPIATLEPVSPPASSGTPAQAFQISNPPQHQPKPNQFPDLSEMMVNLFRAVGPKLWKDVNRMFHDTSYLKFEDTGGQPEFMDMLPALTIGPALYLFFCKLTDDLNKCYTVTYRSPSGESTEEVKSAYTVKELILSALASIACFNVDSEEKSEETEFSGKSVACMIGTYRDKVSEEQLALFDKKLQKSIESTAFYTESLVEFWKEDQLLFPVDNMYGGVAGVKRIQKFLEEEVKNNFEKLKIPAAWLVLSLCLRKRAVRVASLDTVIQLAESLSIPESEIQTALWFLHHRAGVLMYFPKLPELADTVICDPQVIYDSTTNLIVDTLRFGPLPKAAAENFRRLGQFTLEDIRKAALKDSGSDYITLEKLVKLLEHLNIIAPLHKASNLKKSKTMHFMPSILQSLTRQELDTWWENHSSSFPPPLFVHYECGFVPIGVFPALVANIVNNKKVDLIEENIKKNRIQFYYGRYQDKITLITQPKYYAIHIERHDDAKRPIHKACRAVRCLVESSLENVTTCMNYAFNAKYHWAFECTLHPTKDHLCVVADNADEDDSDDDDEAKEDDDDDNYPKVMKCMASRENREPVKLMDHHKVWFGKPQAQVNSSQMQQASVGPISNIVGARFSSGHDVAADAVGATLNDCSADLHNKLNFRLVHPWLKQNKILPLASGPLFVTYLPPENTGTDIHNLENYLKKNCSIDQFREFIDLVKRTAGEAGNAHDELAATLLEIFDKHCIEMDSSKMLVDGNEPPSAIGDISKKYHAQPLQAKKIQFISEREPVEHENKRSRREDSSTSQSSYAEPPQTKKMKIEPEPVEIGEPEDKRSRKGDSSTSLSSYAEPPQKKKMEIESEPFETGEPEEKKSRKGGSSTSLSNCTQTGKMKFESEEEPVQMDQLRDEGSIRVGDISTNYTELQETMSVSKSKPIKLIRPKDKKLRRAVPSVRRMPSIAVERDSPNTKDSKSS